MDSSFDRLIRLLPPPSGEVAAVPWDLSRPQISLDFPADYRRFADHYGGGDVVEPDWVYTPYDGEELDDPGEPQDRVNLSIYGPHGGVWPFEGGGEFHAFRTHQIAEVHSLFAFEDAAEGHWGDTVYPVYPDPGGLLAWGSNIDGDVFFWLTEDPDPDRWPVVMWARGPATMIRFDGGMVDFLVSVLSGEHPQITWLTGPNLTWVMHNDWLHRDVPDSARSFLP